MLLDINVSSNVVQRIFILLFCVTLMKMYFASSFRSLSSRTEDTPPLIHGYFTYINPLETMDWSLFLCLNILNHNLILH